MKILIAGASGLIGQALTQHLTQQGHCLFPLKRGIDWHPEERRIDPKFFAHIDVVINLSGENIASHRWTQKRKKQLLESRLFATQTLVSAMEKLSQPPALFINASATGFYGDSGEIFCDETTPHGTGFLADVCVQWEKAAAAHKGRTAIFRFAPVLSQRGGFLQKLLPLFKLGLGGNLGSGKQWMSWVHIDDLTAAFSFLLQHPTAAGLFNIAAPHPITNAHFTKILGHVLHRPTYLHLPAFILRLLAGRTLADELLLNSNRVKPAHLEHLGFSFRYPGLEGALKDLLR